MLRNPSSIRNVIDRVRTPLLKIHSTRGDLPEDTEHRVAVCISDPAGKVLWQAGKKSYLKKRICLRSSGKPFAAAALVRSGAAKHYNLTPQDLAVISSSHTRQPAHIEAIQSIVQRTGLDLTPLKNVSEGKDPIDHGCSGQHVGMLLLAQYQTDVLEAPNASPESYWEADRPTQQYIRDFAARIMNFKNDSVTTVIDGCNSPALTTTLRNAAMGFARLAEPDGFVDPEDAEALKSIRDAMRLHPHLVHGEGEYDTRFMRAAQDNNVTAKHGYGGVYCMNASFSRSPIGCAIKCLDGDQTAAWYAGSKVATALNLFPLTALDSVNPQNVSPDRVVKYSETAPFSDRFHKHTETGNHIGEMQCSPRTQQRLNSLFDDMKNKTEPQRFPGAFIRSIRHSALQR